MISLTTFSDLTSHNTFGLHATARMYIEYDSPEDLKELYHKGLFKSQWIHIGAGSNLLFAVQNYDGAVLHSGIKNIVVADSATPGEIELTLGAGLVLDEVIADFSEQGYYGIENLSGIPGEVGAGAVQNVGAYGVEFADRIVAVHVFDTRTGETVIFDRERCRYGYRESLFKTGSDSGRYIVTHVRISLSRNMEPVLTYGSLSTLAHDTLPSVIRGAVLAIRASKLPDPKEYGSAGSYFKNPVISPEAFDFACKMYGSEIPFHQTSSGLMKVSAAWLIDRTGLKGERCGGAALWHSQPLVIYNAGNATASDVVKLQQIIVERVRERFGITLIPEVQRVINNFSHQPQNNKWESHS